MRSLQAIGIELPAVREPLENRTPFRGVLHTVDQPSLRPPGGAQGRRVLISRAVAQRALPSLIGAPVNVAQDFKDHDRTTPVGAIHKAYIQGDAVIVEGVLYKRNFPQVVAQIQANKARLGMSYEVTSCEIRSADAPIWELSSYAYTGCAILAQTAAAYGDSTSIAAKAAAPQCDYAGILRVLRAEGEQLKVRSARHA